MGDKRAPRVTPRLKRISEGYDAAEKAAITRAYSGVHFPGPPPTLAEATAFPCGATECRCSRGGCSRLPPPSHDVVVANLNRLLGDERATLARQGEAFRACMVRLEIAEGQLAEACEVIEALLEDASACDGHARDFLERVKKGPQ